LEKARVIDPFRHAGLPPLGKIRLTLADGCTHACPKGSITRAFSSWIWIFVGALVASVIIIAWLLRVRAVKQHKAKEDKLQDALKTETRRRAITELKNVELTNNESNTKQKIVTANNNWEMVEATYSEIDPEFAKKIMRALSRFNTRRSEVGMFHLDGNGV